MTYRTRSPYAAPLRARSAAVSALCASFASRGGRPPRQRSPLARDAEDPTARMRSGLRGRSVVVTLVVVVVVVDSHEVGLLDDLGVVILAAEHRGREGRDVD